MKPILQFLAITGLALSLSSCLFKEPIFSEGFIKTDPALGGVWLAEDETGDPRGREFAVLAPVGQDAFMLHYPVGTKGASYFEVKPLKVGEKDIWQVRLATTFEDGLPAKDTPVYTLLLIEKTGEGKLSIHPLKNEGDHTASAAETKKAIEGKTPDWTKLFGEPKIFTRLKDQ